MNFRSVISICALLSAVSASVGQTVLAQWTFETSLPESSGPFAAEGGLFASQALASGFHVGGGTFSNPVGNGSAESFSSNTWAIGDYYQFVLPTVGYESLTVSWAQNRSSTGPATFSVEASADGTNFTTVGSAYDVGAVTWSSGAAVPESVYSRDLSALTQLNDASQIFIRFVAGSAPGSSGGTNRIDDIVITGTVVPEPSTVLLGLAGIGAVALFLRRRRS